MIKKMMLLAMAIASRGTTNKKTDVETKKLRYLSCYGKDDIQACPNLKTSEKSDFYYCGRCGCGDHPHTWLMRETGVYAKLDYPYLTCPLKMPGFSNYDPNIPKDSLTRKRKIEDCDIEKLNLINLTVSVDEEKEKLFEKIQELKNNK